MLEGLELKLAYLHYIDGNMKESLKCINNYCDKKIYREVSYDEDPFWKTLAKHVFISVIFNKLNKNIEVEEQDLSFLFSNIDKVCEEIKEFCIEFANDPYISFIPYLQRSTSKMISSAVDIIETCLKKQS